jgi:hypothetical protein
MAAAGQPLEDGGDDSSRVRCGLLCADRGGAVVCGGPAGDDDAGHEGVSMRRPWTRRRIWLARALALAADFVQFVVLPFALGNALSPADEIIDVAVGIALTSLLGFHVALLPALAIELVPVLDVFPTWTAAVLFITRGGSSRVPANPSKEPQPPRAE